MEAIKFKISEFNRLPVASLITFTDDRIINMEECVDFLPNPVPTVVNMTSLRNDLQTREATYKAVKSELNKQKRNDAYDALVNGHLDWIGYAEPIIGSNAEQAARFGYPQYLKRSGAEVPEGTPPKPTFALTPNPGEIMLYAATYRQAKKVIFYNWQMSEDGGQTYGYLPTQGNSRSRRISLEEGKTYSFRVAYATTAGSGPFSDWLDVTLTRDMVKLLNAA